MAALLTACRENAHKIAAALAKATGTTTAMISKKYYGKASFFDDFRAGRVSCSIDKFDSMVEAMRHDFPRSAEWPVLRAVVIPHPRRG
jgi:hypothetical protein